MQEQSRYRRAPLADIGEQGPSDWNRPQTAAVRLLLVGVHVRLRGVCGTHHRFVACLCRTLDKALTVSNGPPGDRHYTLECRPISSALCTENTRP
jgi:hypothetical protein